MICITGNLLDYDYFPKHLNLIAIDLSKQTELKNPNFKITNQFFWNNGR